MQTQNKTITRVYTRPAPSILEMKGIRFVGTEGDGTGDQGEIEKVEGQEPEAGEIKQETPEPKVEKTGEPQAGNQEDDKGKTPPWGKDEDFTPEKAWNKIQAVEGDKAKLQRSNEYLKGEWDSSKSRITELEAKVAEYEEKESSANTKAKKSELLEAAGLPSDDEDLISELVGTDESVWEKKINVWKKLAGEREFTPAPKGSDIPGTGIHNKKTADEEQRAAQRARNTRRF